MPEVESRRSRLIVEQLPSQQRYFTVVSRGATVPYTLPLGDISFHDAGLLIGQVRRDAVGFRRRVQEKYAVTKPDGANVITVEEGGKEETVWISRDGSGKFVDKSEDPNPFNAHFRDMSDLSRLFIDDSGWYHPAGSEDSIVQVKVNK